MSADSSTPPSPWARTATLVVLAGLCGLRLLLMGEIHGSARELNVDDALYARGAQSIVEGRWLGDYDEHTLVKMPGYALWLAGLSFFGIPTVIGQEALWMLAALLLFGAQRRLGLNRFLATTGFAVLLFHPIAAWGNYNLLVRETIHHSQVLILVSLLLRFLAPMSDPARLRTSLGLALITAWTWWTREESIWLVPVLGLGLLPAFILELRRLGSGHAVKLVLIAALPSAIAVHAGGLAIKTLNEAHYGAPTTIAFQDEDYRAALGALMRAEGKSEETYLPIHDATLEALYPEAPTLALLRPELLGGAYRSPGMTDADGNRTANYFTFVLRMAAARHGKHRSLVEAKAFYRQVASEVNAVLDRDPERYGERRDDVIPPLRAHHLPVLAREFLELGEDLFFLHFENHGVVRSLPSGSRNADLNALIQRVRRDPEQPSLEHWAYRTRVLLEILRLYRIILPWVGAAAALVILWRLLRLRRRGASPLFWGSLACLAVAALRCALNAAVNAVYCPHGSMYLVSAFPLAVAGSFGLIADALQGLRIPGSAVIARGPIGPLLGVVILGYAVLHIGDQDPREPTRYLSFVESQAMQGGKSRDQIEAGSWSTVKTSTGLVFRPEKHHAFLLLWPWQRHGRPATDLLVEGHVGRESLPLVLVMTPSGLQPEAMPGADPRQVLELKEPGAFSWRLPLRANSLDSARLNFHAKSLEKLEIRRFRAVASENGDATTR